MNTTPITYPFSYSEACPTFRTAVGYRPTTRTNLGGIRFVDFFVENACLLALVFQHSLETVPARVMRGLGIFGFYHRGAGHIANIDCRGFSSYLIRRLVECVSATISDLCVNRFHTLFVTGSLSLGKFGLKRPKPLASDLGAVRQRSNILKAEINAYNISSRARLGIDLYANTKVPSASGIFSEATSTEFILAQPVTIPDIKITPCAIHLPVPPMRRFRLEWNPAKGAIFSVRPPPLQLPQLSLCALGCVLVGDSRNHGVIEMRELSGRTLDVRVKIICRHKLSALANLSTAQFIAIIPDEVRLRSHSPEKRNVFVLDSYLERSGDFHNSQLYRHVARYDRRTNTPIGRCG